MNITSTAQVWFLLPLQVQDPERDYELVTPSRLFAPILTTVVASTVIQTLHYIAHVYRAQPVKGKNRFVASAWKNHDKMRRCGPNPLSGISSGLRSLRRSCGVEGKKEGGEVKG